MGANVTPTPPPGFELDAEAPASSPTPPPGFDLDKESQWSDLPGNIVPDAKSMIGGIAGTAERAGKGVLDFPKDAVTSGIGALGGQPLSETPVGQDVQTVAKGIGSAVAGIPESLMNLGSKDQWIQHPVQNAATVGGLLGGGAEGALTSEEGTGLAGKLGETLEKSGAREASDVAGLTPKTIDRLTRRGENPAVTKVNAGKQLVNEGVVGGFGETPETVFDKYKAQKDNYGNQVKTALGKIKNSGVPPETDSTKALSPIFDEWSKLSEGALPESQSMAKTFAAIHDKLATVADKNGGKLGFDDLHGVMDEVGKQIKRTPKDSPRLGELNHLYSTLAQSRDSIVNDVAQRSGNPALAKELQDANKGYHFYSQIGKDVGKKAAKEGSEKSSNLGFYGALWALGRGDVGKAAEYFVGGRLIGPVTRELTPGMAKHSIQVGQAMKKYGPVLTNAAKKGARNLAVTSSILAQKDPEYGNLLSTIGAQEPQGDTQGQ